MKITALEVLNEMGKRDMDIKLATLENVIGAKKVKAGTKVELGLDGDWFIPKLMKGEIVGVFVVADRKQYDALLTEMGNCVIEVESGNPYTVTTVRCAVEGCHNVRRAVNNWWVCGVAGGDFYCRPYLIDAALSGVDKPVCGQQCANVIFGEYLNRK